MTDNGNSNDNGRQIKFNLDPETAKGVYANLAIIVHSPTEFVVDFASMLPGVEKADVRARVVLAPEHAKRLMLALQDNVRKYEQQFGTIEIHNSRQTRTIAPFATGNGNKGEA